MTAQVLMVIAPESFRDEELLVPRQAFLAQGWQVDTVSTRIGKAVGMFGASEPITRTLDDIIVDRYDAIVVVGGMGSIAHLWHSASLHRVLHAMTDQGAVVSAICISPVVLALAGLLSGRQATVWETPESREALRQAGAHYTGDTVTVDGRVVTGNGPDAAAPFAEAVIRLVRERAAV